MSEKVREITWVAKDSDLRYTKTGKPIVEFRAKIAGNYRTVTYWPESEDEAAYLAGALKKDAQVAVIGVAQDREYTGSDGSQKTALEVKAYHIGPMFGKPYEAKS